MNKKLLIAIIIILIIIIALVCIFNLKPRNKESTIATGETLESTNTIEDSENNTTSNSLLEVSNKAENTIKETNTIESGSNNDNNNNNNTDNENRNSKNEQKNNTITTTNNNTKEETKDKTNNNNSSNTNNEIENTDKQNSDNNKEDEQPKEQEEQDKNEEEEEQQEEINTELANKHFTKYNAEKTAQAVSYLNNLIKNQSDYDEFGGYAIAVTSKPTSNWFSYSDYKLNGLALSGYIVKVYIEDEYAYNSRGTSYSLYDTKAYVYQEILN